MEPTREFFRQLEEQKAQAKDRNGGGAALCYENAHETQAKLAHAVGYIKALTFALEKIVPKPEQESTEQESE